MDCNKLVPAVRGADRRHPRSESGGRKRCWDLREGAAEKAAGGSELLADLASRLRFGSSDVHQPTGCILPHALKSQKQKSVLTPSRRSSVKCPSGSWWKCEANRMFRALKEKMKHRIRYHVNRQLSEATKDIEFARQFRAAQGRLAAAGVEET